MAQHYGNALEWHEWFGQFKSAINSAALADDVKLTYLETLVTRKANLPSLSLLTVVAFTEMPWRFLGVNLATHKLFLVRFWTNWKISDHLKCVTVTISSIFFGQFQIQFVFRSLNYYNNSSSASLLNQVIQKPPLNLKARSTHTVRRNSNKPTLIDFNEWLKEKAEGHERMKMSIGKNNSDGTCTSNAIRTKPGTKVFASAAESSQQSNPVNKSKIPVTATSNCVVWEAKHPLCNCPVFPKKTPTERTKTVAVHNLCFSCLHGQHFLRQCRRPRKGGKEGFNSMSDSLKTSMSFPISVYLISDQLKTAKQQFFIIQEFILVCFMLFWSWQSNWKSVLRKKLRLCRRLMSCSCFLIGTAFPHIPEGIQRKLNQKVPKLIS